jgi:endonuclease/exonuclease/phosphatase family metal-dependent hydrolase
VTPRATRRAWALTAALAATTESLAGPCPTGRLFTAARIARAAGKREAAIALLDEAKRRFSAGQTLALDEPFLAPTDRFDDVPVTGSAAAWGLAATVEAHEGLRAWSSSATAPPACSARGSSRGAASRPSWSTAARR